MVIRLVVATLVAVLATAPGAAGAQTGSGTAPSTTEAPAGGPDAEPESDGSASVRGTITDPDGEPVEGVTIVVEQDGEEVGDDVTDEEGSWNVPVPGAGTYQVTIDTETLPEGVGLRDPDRSTLDAVRVREGQSRPVLFPLGEGAASGTARFERLANLAADGIRLGLILAMASMGLSLIYGVTGLVNFAHGELVTFGALAAYFFSVSATLGDVPLLAAAVLAVALGGAAGWLLERGLFRPLRHRRTGNISLIVVTIGLSLFLRHVYLIVFEGRPRPYDEFTIQRGFDIGPVSLRPKDWAIIVIAAVVLLLVGLMLQRTRLGTAMRAVRDNRDLAASSGIDVERVILATWVLGGVLAALGGVMQGISETVTYDMGFTLLLLMFAAVILGGIGTAYGALLGALVIGLASQLSTYWISPKFRIGVGLAVLIAVVLSRPQGILGRSERIG